MSKLGTRGSVCVLNRGPPRAFSRGTALLPSLLSFLPVGLWHTDSKSSSCLAAASSLMPTWLLCQAFETLTPRELVNSAAQSAACFRRKEWALPCVSRVLASLSPGACSLLGAEVETPQEVGTWKGANRLGGGWNWRFRKGWIKTNLLFAWQDKDGVLCWHRMLRWFKSLISTSRNICLMDLPYLFRDVFLKDECFLVTSWVYLNRRDITSEEVLPEGSGNHLPMV